MKIFAQTSPFMKSLFCNYFKTAFPDLEREISAPILVEGDSMPFWVWTLANGWTFIYKYGKMMFQPQPINFTLCMYQDGHPQYRVYEAKQVMQTIIVLELLPPLRPVFDREIAYEVIDIEPCDRFLHSFAKEKVAYRPEELKGSISEQGLRIAFKGTVYDIPQMSFADALEKRDLFFSKDTSEERIKDIILTQFDSKKRAENLTSLAIYPIETNDGKSDIRIG